MLSGSSCQIFAISESRPTSGRAAVQHPCMFFERHSKTQFSEFSDNETSIARLKSCLSAYQYDCQYVWCINATPQEAVEKSRPKTPRKRHWQFLTARPPPLLLPNPAKLAGNKTTLCMRAHHLSRPQTSAHHRMKYTIWKFKMWNRSFRARPPSNSGSYTTATSTTAIHHSTSSSCRSGGYCNHCSHSKKHSSNHFSVHQWVRSDNHASQQLTFPIVSYLWNFRHRLARSYWYIIQ